MLFPLKTSLVILRKGSLMIHQEDNTIFLQKTKYKFNSA